MSSWKQRVKQQLVDRLQRFVPSVADDLVRRRPHDRWTKTTETLPSRRGANSETVSFRAKESRTLGVLAR